MTTTFTQPRNEVHCYNKHIWSHVKFDDTTNTFC